MSTYPKADTTTQWWDDDWGWAIIKPNVYVLHTTEGFDWPSYRDPSGKAGAKAPHMTMKPDFTNRRLRMRQHFHNEHSSRALANATGGVTTNTNNAYQVELVGTCDKAHRLTWGTRKVNVDYIYWPEAPEWALRDLAEHIAYLHNKFPAFPIKSTVEFAVYDEDASPPGLQKNVRLSGAAWNQYYGILGHQHVPENSHGDPGKFPIAELIELATGGTLPTPTTATVTVYPNPTLSGHDISVRGTVVPAVPGTFAFQYSTDGGKNWVTWANVNDSANSPVGNVSTEARPGGDQKYRVVFTPTDKTKYSGDTSDSVDVDVYNLTDLLPKGDA